jgi:hypothetical protein
MPDRTTLTSIRGRWNSEDSGFEISQPERSPGLPDSIKARNSPISKIKLLKGKVASPICVVAFSVEFDVFIPILFDLLGAA